MTDSASSPRQVRLAQVLAGAVPFRAGNINDTFRGVVRTEDGDRTAIIKDLAQRELANEVLAAALGLAIGLPIPPAYLAYAASDRFPATKGPLLDSGRLVFASVDVGQPQVAMLCEAHGHPAVLRRLAAWSEAGQLYGFDALVANIDRHAGNLLFSGDREVWMIDHGHCFIGPQWADRDLVPADVRVRSRLQEWLTPALGDRQKQLAAHEALRLGGSALVNFADLAVANYMAELLDEGDFNAVVTFLQGRQPYTAGMAAEALGMLA
ncbi:hypothetical protein HNP47_002848 [Brevundimonas vesicularis]|uniref:HipA-like kinase domain-containing protein n=1 Tax=Brevundimonas vesicularis TaxID=41276 RepID=A0A7W9L6V8_BREVE|nr:HipA family kinase [Brevundimonas vesicularis]MBB5772828.1 hypothetical protein [Brevundimonas vesicularis]